MAPDLRNFRVVGVSHATAPVEVRERLSCPQEALADCIGDLTGAGVTGPVVLSTCNRFEVYGVCAGGGVFQKYLADRIGPSGAWHWDDSVYTHREGDAVRHLFRVAAGLDSMVVGENEILGQVRRAYQTAQSCGAVDATAHAVFQAALKAGRRVRAETGLSQGRSSVASVAVELAGRIFGDLSKCSVLLLGAGKMAESAARGLLCSRARELVIINRTVAKGRELAKILGGSAFSMDDLSRCLASADVVISSTAARDYIVGPAEVSSARKRRVGRASGALPSPQLCGGGARPLFFIDISVPRNIDPALRRMDGVFVYDIDDLSAIVAESLQRRRGEVGKAGKIIEEELGKFLKK